MDRHVLTPQLFWIALSLCLTLSLSSIPSVFLCFCILVLKEALHNARVPFHTSFLLLYRSCHCPCDRAPHQGVKLATSICVNYVLSCTYPTGGWLWVTERYDKSTTTQINTGKLVLGYWQSFSSVFVWTCMFVCMGLCSFLQSLGSLTSAWLSHCGIPELSREACSCPGHSVQRSHKQRTKHSYITLENGIERCRFLYKSLYWFWILRFRHIYYVYNVIFKRVSFENVKI